MSGHRDLDDTANLRKPDAGIPDASSPLIDDTDQIQLGGKDEAPEDRDQDAYSGPAHADGIIRFYRAREILATDTDRASWKRAWDCIHPLAPMDLPAVAREPLFQLAYFMQEQISRSVFDVAEFGDRIREIAGRIDAVVDERIAELNS